MTKARLSLLVMLGLGSVSYADSGAPASGEPATRPTSPVDRCVTSECHAQVLSGKILHGPTAQKKCDACHTLHDAAEHRFDLTVPKRQLCTSCHLHTERTVVHQPVADGDCTGCHDPHGSNHRSLLIDDPAGGLCFRCHPAEHFTKKKHVHGPVAAGACVICHEAHSSWNEKLLTRSQQEICLLCHDDVLDALRMARHPHEPVARGRCTTCHDPHASDHKAQIREQVPSLCLACHPKIRELIETSTHVHAAVQTQDACLSCHSGHGGTLPKLLAQPPMDLCLSCHDRPIEMPDGHALADMATLLRDHPDHHGPIRRADCVACHNPHASSHFRLLAYEYPPLFYAPFDLKNYELCFTCHLVELATVERGLGVTGFRNGELNLHFVHVHKDKKGRTCRACHEVHASKRPFHIREKVPFGSGGWEIEINFETRPDGGRCAPGCHETRTYSRVGSPVPTTRTGVNTEVTP